MTKSPPLSPYVYLSGLLLLGTLVARLLQALGSWSGILG